MDTYWWKILGVLIRFPKTYNDSQIDLRKYIVFIPNSPHFYFEKEMVSLLNIICYSHVHVERERNKEGKKAREQESERGRETELERQTFVSDKGKIILLFSITEAKWEPPKYKVFLVLSLLKVSLQPLGWRIQVKGAPHRIQAGYIYITAFTFNTRRSGYGHYHLVNENTAP